MLRDREAGATPPGPTPPGLSATALLPLTLLAAALVAAFLASQDHHAAWLNALALLLACAGALVSGAYWARQRQADRLREARLHGQLLGQLVDCWQWQTDAEHRLVRLQPPQGAPASAWVEGAFSGVAAWQRFDDEAGSLRQRLQAHAVLQDLRVHDLGQTGAARRSWRLRALPRFDAKGRFHGHLGVAMPTRDEDQTRQLRRLFDKLLQAGPAALCMLAPTEQGWQLVQASPQAAALLGQPPEGLPASGLPWAQAAQALPEALRALLPGPPAHASTASNSLNADGWAARWLPLDDPGAPTGPWLLVLAPTDTGSDTALRALAAEHAAFSYTISHDLRAPIRVVEGFGQILREDYGPQLDRIGNDHLDRMVSAAARMNQMIDALLALSQLSTQPLSRQAVNLSQLAGFVVDDLRRATPERQVAVHITPGLSAAGDPTLLRLVLENLLGNAWKYSAKNPAAELQFDLVQQAGRPVFVVADNGAGFDMRFADRLFGVFQRLHSASDFQGTGVGLASVRRIVRRHGGEVWAESEVGRGARFYFTLKA